MKSSFLHIISPRLAVIFFLIAHTVILQAKVVFPGKIISESPDPLKMTIGSPSIVVLPDGSYLASHDWGGDAINGTYSSIYKSTDKGINWKLVSTVKDVKCATLFWFKGNLYLMGVKSDYGDICIRHSANAGINWSEAVSSTTGLLFKGRFYTAPVPVVIHNGRIWRAYEESVDALHPQDLKAFVISAPIEADLLNAANWTKSSGVNFNPDWINATSPAWLEGNMVINPDGNLVDFVRVISEQEKNGDFALGCPADSYTRYKIAAKIPVSADGKTVSFDPYSNFTNFPGAMSKFTIRYDTLSGKYWSIANKITTTNYKYLGASNSPVNQKNVLVLYSSTDLENWEEKYILLRWNEADVLTQRVNFGFQYADWQIDGNDIVAVVKTSWYGSDLNEGNMLTFHKIPNFRSITMDASPADLSTLTDNVTPLLQWQFTSPSSTGKEVSAASTTTNTYLNASVLTRGAGLTNTSGFARSFSAATALADVEDNSKEKAVADNQYFQFIVQAKEGYSVSLSTIDAKLSRNSEGPTSYRWAYSLDGASFTEISSGDVSDFTDDSGEGEEQTTVRLDSYSDLQNVPSSKQVIFRIYLWRATLSSGRISFGRYKDTTPSLKVGGSVNLTPLTETPIAAWTFAGLTGITVGDVAASICNEQLKTPLLGRGAGLTALSLTNAYYSSFSSYATSANSKSNAISNNDFYTFAIQPQAGAVVSLSKLNAKLRRNSTGPVSYRWMYSVDNVHFNELGVDDVVFLSNNDNGVVQTSIDLSTVSDLQNIKSTTPVFFRLYAWGAMSSAGGLAFGRYTGENCLSVYGTVGGDVEILNAWQFYDDNGVISTGREETYSSTTTNSAVEVSTILRGTGNTVTSSGHTGGFIGYMTISQSKQEAISNNCYFQLTVQAKKGLQINISAVDARLRRQEFSAYKYRWMYSFNGADFYELGAVDSEIADFAENNGYVQPTLLLDNYAELKSLTADKPVTFRLYAWGGSETATTRKHFGFGQSKLAAGPALKITGSVRNATTTSLVEDAPVTIKVFTSSGTISVCYRGSISGKTTVELKGILGRTLINKQLTIQEGENIIRIPCVLSNGIYVLTLQNNGQIYSVKFVK
ncbi:MAG: T9SS type A sorting domain-containing protein [Paludibacteraceae bacterium]